MSVEERMIELETRIAFQEDQLEQLNQALSSQQIELTEANRLIKVLFERISDLSADLEQSQQKGGGQERPPHY